MLLGLVMIVKDEAPGIEETLLSIRPAIDHFTILDTGSTDGTQEKIRQTLAVAGIPGTIHEEPFVDFATTRNRALDLHARKTLFSLMLSGDECVEGAEALRAFCRSELRGSHGAYDVRVALGEARFDSARLARTSAKWRYEGAVHEVLVGPAMPGPRLPGVLITHNAVRHAATSRERWQRDVKLLEAEAEKRPTHGRTIFYLAQTYECLGNHEEADRLYARRVMLGGWREEVYEAMLRRVRCAQKLSRGADEIEILLLVAHQFESSRAEAPCLLAELKLAAGAREEAREWARKTLTLPRPDHVRMFVDTTVRERAEKILSA